MRAVRANIKLEPRPVQASYSKAYWDPQAHKQEAHCLARWAATAFTVGPF